MKLSPYLHLDRIEFIVTCRCTGRCLHCSVGDALNRPADAALTPEAAADTVSRLAALYDVQSVMTFGGEPLLKPEITCAIHRAAREAGIPQRQLITNGFFSKNEERIRETARALAEAGVNNLLVSVDAFHQQTIPLEPVRCFARSAQEAGIAGVKLSPAWVVNEQHDNAYNARTREVLAAMADLKLPVGDGNDIFMAGNAAKNLADFYPKPCLDVNQRCGAMPYTEPLTDVHCLSIEPDGDVTACSFPIGNVLKEPVEEIVARYDPYQHEVMRAVTESGARGLLALAQKYDLDIDIGRCYSVCDLCRMVNAAYSGK